MWMCYCFCKHVPLHFMTHNNLDAMRCVRFGFLSLCDYNACYISLCSKCGICLMWFIQECIRCVKYGYWIVSIRITNFEYVRGDGRWMHGNKSIIDLSCHECDTGAVKNKSNQQITIPKLFILCTAYKLISSLEIKLWNLCNCLSV